MSDQVKRIVKLIIPMSGNMELTAAQTGSSLAGMMNFEDHQIDEIQWAIIETCINAFEHSLSYDPRIFIKFIMKDDELELRIRDRGSGFIPDRVKPLKTRLGGDLRKRGWGMEIIRSMMDAVNVQSSEEGTTVTMIKKKISRKSARAYQKD